MSRWLAPHPFGWFHPDDLTARAWIAPDRISIRAGRTLASEAMAESLHITVNVLVWEQATEATQTAYLARAKELGIELQAGATGWASSEDLLVVRDLPAGAHIDIAFFAGEPECERPLWEHALRRQLDLPDPCFPTDR